MREMVLNHASLVAENRYVATEWLYRVSKMNKCHRSLNRLGLVKSPTANASKYLHEVSVHMPTRHFSI